MPAGLKKCSLRTGQAEFFNIADQRTDADRDLKRTRRVVQRLQGDGRRNIGKGEMIDPFLKQVADHRLFVRADGGKRPSRRSVEFLDAVHQAHAAGRVDLRFFQPGEPKFQIIDLMAQGLLTQR